MKRTIKIGTVTAVSPDIGAVRVSFFDEDSAVSAQLPVIMPTGVVQMPKVKDSVACIFLSSGSNDGFCLGGTYYIQGEKLPTAFPAAVQSVKVSGKADSVPYPEGWKTDDTFILAIKGTVNGQLQQISNYKAVYTGGGIDIELTNGTLTSVMLGRVVT